MIKKDPGINHTVHPVLTNALGCSLQEGVQELQVPAGGAPADFGRGGRSFGTRPADGDGHGVSERRRASPGAVQEPGASGTGRPGAAGGPDAPPEAFAERRRQRMRARGVYLGAARTQARPGEKLAAVARNAIRLTGYVPTGERWLPDRRDD